MRTLFFLLALAVIAGSCEKIVAEDITANTPVLIIPTVNDTVSTNPVHFKWEEMEGASKYRLQVVSPSFASINAFALDSIITGTEFFFSLDSNEYELKLTAQNGGYESQVLGPIKFWVGVQPSGGGNGVVLSTPAASAFVNASFNNQFTWNALFGATSYEYSLRSGNSFETGLLVTAQNNISTTLFTEPTVLTEGEYHWGVKAYLSGSETSFSTRTLYVDTTNPNVALLSAPADLALISQGTVTFTWNNGTDPGTINAPVNSLIEVATDSGFSSIVHSSTVQGNTVDVSLTANTYYWRVTNTDDAGNSAASSSTNQFTLF